MKRLFLYFFIGITILSCKDDKEFEFDRTALLTQAANEIIIPSYTNLKNDLVGLKADFSTFNSSRTIGNLNSVQNQFDLVYIAFQKVKMFEFGPAADMVYRSSMNTYPTNTTKINANIESGSYILGSAENATAIGLPALDYLLYYGNESEVLLSFTSDDFAENRLTYLADIIEKMNDETNQVLANWTGSYKSTFMAANGTDIGSSLSLLFNQFVIDLELVKNAKIGIPSGQFSGGETFPTYVESNYGSNSKILALTNMQALKTLFMGGTGVGIDDYMDASVEFGTTTIPSSDIIAQFDICISKINALEDPFNETIPSNLTGFNDTFQEIKKLVAYAKTDIPAALGVLISFSDTDGD